MGKVNYSLPIHLAMDLNISSRPYRIFCNTPLEYFPQLVDVIPVVLKIVIKNDRIVKKGGICFKLGEEGADEGYFMIRVQEKDKEYHVLIQDVEKDYCLSNEVNPVDQEDLTQLIQAFQSIIAPTKNN